jgi:hypothetical protein
LRYIGSIIRVGPGLSVACACCAIFILPVFPHSLASTPSPTTTSPTADARRNAKSAPILSLPFSYHLVLLLSYSLHLSPSLSDNTAAATQQSYAFSSFRFMVFLSVLTIYFYLSCASCATMTRSPALLSPRSPPSPLLYKPGHSL